MCANSGRVRSTAISACRAACVCAAQRTGWVGGQQERRRRRKTLNRRIDELTNRHLVKLMNRHLAKSINPRFGMIQDRSLNQHITAKQARCSVLRRTVFLWQFADDDGV